MLTVYRDQLTDIHLQLGLYTSYSLQVCSKPVIKMVFNNKQMQYVHFKNELDIFRKFLFNVHKQHNTRYK